MIRTLPSRLVAVVALMIPLAELACAEDRLQDFSRTEWRVTTAEGLDALLLIGVASGDPLQAEHYPEAVGWVEENVSRAGREAMRELDRIIGDGEQALTGPVLTLFFSAGPHETLDDVIERVGHRRSVYATEWPHPHSGGRGRPFEEWLSAAIERGMLTPREVRRRAAMVVGEEAVGAWW